MEKGSFVWVLKNYSLQKQKTGGTGKAIESEEFTAAGHRWTLLFYPYGRYIDAYEDGYASIYLSLKSKTYDDPVRCVYEMFLVNQSKFNYRSSGISLFIEKLGVPRLNGGELTGVRRFLKRAKVESPDFLQDDCLRIRCTIGVLISPIPDGANFGDLLESEEGADVFFRVENQTLYAHKGILAARFPAYSRFIQLHCKEPQKFVIKNMESRIFKAVLWFIYTGNLPEKELKVVGDSSPYMLIKFTGKLHAAADRFNLIKLKMKCESHILETLSGELAENQDALVVSGALPYVKKIFPSLFPKLVCYEETPFTSGQRELGLSSRILAVAKESFVGVCGDASKMNHKVKVD